MAGLVNSPAVYARVTVTITGGTPSVTFPSWLGLFSF
jgi:hypothetical protein